MFKRVRWMGMGAVAGIGASAWAQHRVRRTLEEHPAIQAGAGVAATARQVGREVVAAVGDGRRAMAEREAVLRAELAARTDPGARADAGARTGRTDPTRTELARAGRHRRRTTGTRHLHVVDTTAIDVVTTDAIATDASTRDATAADALEDPGTVPPVR